MTNLIAGSWRASFGMMSSIKPYEFTYIRNESELVDILHAHMKYDINKQKLAKVELNTWTPFGSDIYKLVTQAFNLAKQDAQSAHAKSVAKHLVDGESLSDGTMYVRYNEKINARCIARARSKSDVRVRIEQ